MSIKNGFYIKNTVVAVDESEYWEFKGHRNFCSDDIPAWRSDGTKVCPSKTPEQYKTLRDENRTRQPISRNICGFLNAGKGGTILLGVLDTGVVVGLSMSPIQRDHLLLSLTDTLNRFDPPVPPEMVSVKFVPLIDPEQYDVSSYQPDERLCEPIGFVRRQTHQLRTSSLCWCDIHTMNRLKIGYMAGEFVVEVCVAPMQLGLRSEKVQEVLEHMADSCNVALSRLERLSWPAFHNEDGNYYYRILNSLTKFTKEEIRTFHLLQVQDYLKIEIKKLGAAGEDATDLKAILKEHPETVVPPRLGAPDKYLEDMSLMDLEEEEKKEDCSNTEQLLDLDQLCNTPEGNVAGNISNLPEPLIPVSLEIPSIAPEISKTAPTGNTKSFLHTDPSIQIVDTHNTTQDEGSNNINLEAASIKFFEDSNIAQQDFESASLF